MTEYFTSEFFNELADRLNKDDEFQDKASDLSIDLLNVAKDKDRAFLLSIDDGKVQIEEASEDTDADFKFIGSYDNWVKNHKGEASLEKSIMTGKIKLKGSVPKIMRLRDKLGRIDDLGTEIDAEYE